MTSDFKHKTHSRKSGFTTIEISIVLIISGLMFTMLLQYYSVIKSRQAYEATKERLVEIDDALTSIVGMEGHYPCPADPTLPPNHDDYGVAIEICDICVDETTRPLLSDGTPSNLICTQEGTRDIDGDGENEFVVIGALPFRTLYESTSRLPVPFNQASGVDGYNNLFTYAVTEEMASNSYNPLRPVTPYIGAVHMIDENGTEMSDPPSSAQFVLISHGPNGKGGYTIQGTQIENCFVSSTGAPPTPGYEPFGTTAGLNPEIENCDGNDGVFTKALLALNDEDSYFDDTVYFRNRTATSLWQASPGDSGNNHIFSANIGNVGVVTEDPLAKFHVVGNVRVDNQVRADRGFCAFDHDWTGMDRCLQPELLAEFDPDIGECDPGEVAIGIQNNRLVCQPLIRDSATVEFDVSCPPNEYPSGIRYNRNTNIFTESGCRSGGPTP